MSTVTAPEALQRLIDGNRRFASNLRSVESMTTQAKRAALTGGQSPFAIILSCSDSRAPSELIFDAGLGDLFVVRVAGPVCAPSLVGSVEFAASQFGTQLVVVMGHTQCGAIKATLDTLARGHGPASENIRDIVERIAPAIRDAVREGDSAEQQYALATRANVRHTADHLRHGSRVLEGLIKAGGLSVVGAEYSLSTGQVDFFDGV